MESSARGEYEITGTNKEYLRRGELKVEVLPRGTAWLDTGTFSDLSDDAVFAQTVQDRQGLEIGALGEVAWREGFISGEQLREVAGPSVKSGCGEYLPGLWRGDGG